jgi:hypothetical protein
LANEAQAALDHIRNRLQVILSRAELCNTSQQCELCASTVCKIVEEIRTLEAFVQSFSTTN